MKQKKEMAVLDGRAPSIPLPDQRALDRFDTFRCDLAELIRANWTSPLCRLESFSWDGYDGLFYADVVSTARDVRGHVLNMEASFQFRHTYPLQDAIGKFVAEIDAWFASVHDALGGVAP